MARKLSPERRERFLDTALKLFAQNGIQHTSTAAIAKESGSAAGTLFIYFPTKQDLIHELILQISRAQSTYIKERLDPTLSARETFFTIWNSSIHWFLNNIDTYLYIQQVRDTGTIAEEVIRETEKYLDYYFFAIQKGFASGRIKPYPIELIGNILYQDIVAVTNLIRAEQNPDLQDETIQIGFDIFWDGIKTVDESYPNQTQKESN